MPRAAKAEPHDQGRESDQDQGGGGEAQTDAGKVPKVAERNPGRDEREQREEPGAEGGQHGDGQEVQVHPRTVRAPGPADGQGQQADGPDDAAERRQAGQGEHGDGRREGEVPGVSIGKLFYAVQSYSCILV